MYKPGYISSERHYDAFMQPIGKDGYAISGPNVRGYTKGWYHVDHTQAKRLPKPSEAEMGWKVHISTSTPAALDELAELGMRHQIPKFKFTDPHHESFGAFRGPSEKQAGKSAVFYYREQGVDGKPIDWKAFMEEAESIVHAHGGPGPAVQYDKLVPGSKGVVFYRKDRVKGEYLSRLDQSRIRIEHDFPPSRLFNIEGAPDPFVGLVLGKEIPVSPPPHTMRPNTTNPRSQAIMEPVVERPATVEDLKRLTAEEVDLSQTIKPPTPERAATVEDIKGLADTTHPTTRKPGPPAKEAPKAEHKAKTSHAAETPAKPKKPSKKGHSSPAKPHEPPTTSRSFSRAELSAEEAAAHTNSKGKLAAVGFAFAAVVGLGAMIVQDAKEKAKNKSAPENQQRSI